MLTSNEYTLTQYLTHPYKMTFVLGSRCKDGVVLVADMKITSTNEYELFRENVVEQVRKSIREMIANDNENHHEITYDNIILMLNDIVLDINKKRDFMKNTIWSCSLLLDIQISRLH